MCWMAGQLGSEGVAHTGVCLAARGSAARSPRETVAISNSWELCCSAERQHQNPGEAASGQNLCDPAVPLTISKFVLILLVGGAVLSWSVSLGWIPTCACWLSIVEQSISVMWSCIDLPAQQIRGKGMLSTGLWAFWVHGLVVKSISKLLQLVAIMLCHAVNLWFKFGADCEAFVPLQCHLLL